MMPHVMAVKEEADKLLADLVAERQERLEVDGYLPSGMIEEIAALENISQYIGALVKG